MTTLQKNIEELEKLLKAIQSNTFKLPQMNAKIKPSTNLTAGALKGPRGSYNMNPVATKAPGIAPTSQTNPVKQAAQMSGDKGLRNDAMKLAQQAVASAGKPKAIRKSEQLTFSDNGQWVLN